ncbi:unnamed protein product [Orchesella dallaii]|uniref:POPDC1-3 domain-containing protein n=1 Tax=Orchesella dallaii TaxID=48710 RepID=A0ABP1QRW1_9HEXA
MADFVDYNFDYNYGNQETATQASYSSSDLLTNYRCVLLNYPENSSSIYTYYSLWLFSSNPIHPPNTFTPIHHVIYQITQLLLLIFLILAHHSKWSLLFITGYSILSLLWGILILKSIDIVIWNAIHLILITILWIKNCCCGSQKATGTKGSSSANLAKHSEIDSVYTRLFAPVRVSYKQFIKIISCKRGFKNLTSGENYAIEKRTRVDSLGLLVSGRLVVSQAGKPLHVILPFQFVDSPEYFGVATDELFQVTITALEESKLLVWHRDKLRLTIMNDEFLRVIFDHIIGRDVVRKLIQVSDTIMTTTTTTFSSCTSPASTTISGSSPSHSNGNSSIVPSMQPIMLMRKDKYAYQPTYLRVELVCLNEKSASLTSLSEERGGKIHQNGFDAEEYEDEEPRLVITGNEKQPMLPEQLLT